MTEIRQIKKLFIHVCGNWCKKKKKNTAGARLKKNNHKFATTCKEGHPCELHETAGFYGKFGEWEERRVDPIDAYAQPFSLELYLISRFHNVNCKNVSEDKDVIAYLFGYLNKNREITELLQVIQEGVKSSLDIFRTYRWVSSL